MCGEDAEEETTWTAGHGFVFAYSVLLTRHCCSVGCASSFKSSLKPMHLGNEATYTRGSVISTKLGIVFS